MGSFVCRHHNNSLVLNDQPLQHNTIIITAVKPRGTQHNGSAFLLLFDQNNLFKQRSPSFKKLANVFSAEVKWPRRHSLPNTTFWKGFAFHNWSSKERHTFSGGTCSILNALYGRHFVLLKSSSRDICSKCEYYVIELTMHKMETETVASKIELRKQTINLQSLQYNRMCLYLYWAERIHNRKSMQHFCNGNACPCKLSASENIMVVNKPSGYGS